MPWLLSFLNSPSRTRLIVSHDQTQSIIQHHGYHFCLPPALHTDKMGFLKETTLSKYIKSIKASPRSLIANKHLINTALLFALGGISLCTHVLNISPRERNSN